MAKPGAGCGDFNRFVRCQRRDLLIAGGLATILPSLSHRSAFADEPTSAAPRRARSILMIYLFGGPGQLDTFDMKPEAPAEVRGEFKPIPSSLPGLSICEHLPRTAQVMDRLTVVRTMQHDRTVHGGAVVYALTGELNKDPGIPGIRGPDASLADHPNIGSTIRRFGPAETQFPNAVTLPWRMIDGQGREPPGQWAGMLGKVYNPWLIESDPNRPDFRIDALRLPAEISPDRMEDRRSLLALIEQQTRSIEQQPQLAQADALLDQALRLITSSKVRQAFDLDREPAALRGRYGRNTFGQSCLLGRRLVEAGVQYVQLNMGNGLNGDFGWDTHSKTFPRMKDLLCPKFDPAFATLIEDLDSRGLLDQTLVLVNSEFGRSPKIQRSNGGRDHWPNCYSLLFAGAGIGRGQVVGQSDRQAAYPITPPFSPADVAATLYQVMGIDPRTQLVDHQNRPVALNRGRFMSELFG